jgi:hypothetical protein
MCALTPAYDFKLALTRVIGPTGGPGAELATLEDAARFVGLMRPWRQARLHWDFAAELLLKAAQTKEESDIEVATAQLERALRVEGWL